MKQSISPYQLPGRQSYVCTYAAPGGKRVTRGLGTQIKSEALSICMELEKLSEVGATEDDSLIASLISPSAWRIWFGKEPPESAVGLMGKDLVQLQTQVRGLNTSLIEARNEVARLLPIEAAYKELCRSIEGQRILAAKRSPSLADVRESYFEDLAQLARGGSFHRTWFDRFSASLGASRKVAEISPGQVADFLRRDAAEHTDPHRAKRMRTIISRFFSWARIHHGIISPLDQVPSAKVQAERDIQWHSLEEVEAVLAPLDSYWRAMIACMAFAGLSAHEVRGLRRGDLVESRGAWSLRITPTNDRGLKTAKRRRSVPVSKRLAPILQAHLATLPADAEILFPPLIGHGEIWNANTFTRELGRILPDGMDALSLRRTFGSLLIRSGKSAEEVSGVMGNSAAIVTRHYGRILGGEVEIDF